MRYYFLHFIIFFLNAHNENKQIIVVFKNDKKKKQCKEIHKSLKGTG